jgi:tRNA pseudouridine55 synthase
VLAPDDQLRDGVAIVDKPAGWTSHDVVAKARGLLRNKKIGHSGTLDPDATGVLLLGVGRVTRLLRFLTVLHKTYTGVLVLGIETTTLDASGEVTATHDMTAVDADAVRTAVVSLTGDLLQVPPMVSAIRVGGKRLHELAREGIEVERKPRPVAVYRFDVEPDAAESGVYRFVVECSSGTYVRSLVADLGHALGGGAHMRSLRRTAIGSFTVDEARPLDEIEVLQPATAIRDYDSLTVEPDKVIDVGHGKPLYVHGGFDGVTAQEFAVFDEAGKLLAMYQRVSDDTAKPTVVLAPAEPRSSSGETDG